MRFLRFLGLWVLSVGMAVWMAKLAEGACSKRVYIIPLMQKNVCDGNKNSCHDVIRGFVTQCRNAVSDKKREQIALLLPPYTQFTYCYLGPRGDCESVQIGNDDVILKANATFNIYPNIERLLRSEQSSCLDESMAIFLTDIPCGDYRFYGDLQDLFGDGFNKTANAFNTEYYLHTIVGFLRSTNNSDNENFRPCEDLRNHHDVNNESHIELRYYEYSTLANSANICDSGFRNLRQGDHRRDNEMSDAMRMGIIIGCSVIGSIMLAIATFCAFRIRRRYLESKIDMFAEEHASRARRLFFSPPADPWELTPKELKVDAEIVLGTGVSATVYKGHVKMKRDNQTIEKDVAVKFAHSYADESVRKDMIREIEFMKTLGKHDNLLLMVGCVKDPQNPVIATDFCVNGDLLKLLRKHTLHLSTPERCDEVDICLSVSDLLRIAIEVCAGMVHLNSLKYVHRDLAARNVLLTEDMTAKVGDFGLCRLATDALYTQKAGKLPIKHMSYEALKFGEFSEKSDVWAYGIMMFEMFTGGERPFADIETEQIIRHLENGGFPELPQDETPDDIRIMVETMCFSMKASQRSTFSEIYEELQNIKKNYDVD